MDITNDLIEYVGDRPGHDKRYSIDSSKIQNEIGWKPAYDFDNAINFAPIIKITDFQGNNENISISFEKINPCHFNHRMLNVCSAMI